jgi:anti-sigma28 factor (negative regulator of flagellin synthesis)
MAIQEIITSSGSVDPVKGSKAQPQEKPPPREKAAGEAEEKSDRVEVSEEARALYEAEQSNRLERLRENIRHGLYLDEQVTERIVDALLKEIQTPPTDQ